MTVHDELCPFAATQAERGSRWCDWCDFAERVREHERGKHLAKWEVDALVETAREQGRHEQVGGCIQHFRIGRASALADAAKMVRALPGVGSHVEGVGSVLAREGVLSAIESLHEPHPAAPQPPTFVNPKGWWVR